jgi:glycosyltransferase involved in cell wall biosynthesis
MNIAYLINQYPKTSHSFIRREILAVEACGVQVTRFSIRSLAAELVDDADRQELTKTRYLLENGLKGLISDLVRVVLTRPDRFLRALRLAVQVGWQSERGVGYHLAYLAEACKLLRWVTQDKITHVHVHFGTNSATVALLCQELGGPTYSFTVHGPEEFDKPNAIALSQKLQRAAFVVAVSSFGRSQLFRWCPYKQWSKIHVIRCGVDQLFLEHPEIPIPELPRFVCVGRLSEQKGHLLLVEAVSLLAAEGLQFKLVLVGDGDLRNQIEAMIAHFGLENYIEITGWATNAEVQQQILNAQVLVAPSFAEGLPVVLMESLALCRPVISTYIAGIPELVQPESGWLIPAGSVKALAAAMRTALHTPTAKLAEMGRTGADRVRQFHNAVVEADKLASLFKT